MPSLAVTIPKSAAEAARIEFDTWGAVTSARILGENETEMGLLVTIEASAVAMALGNARQVMEQRVRKVGGRVGVKDEWLAADADHGDLMTG